MKGNGVYPELCSRESLERAVLEMDPAPSGPLWQVNHFVGASKVPSYAVFYDGPVWITELHPGSYRLLQTASVPKPKLDSRVLCGTHVTAFDPQVLWTSVSKQWYPPWTLFRLRPGIEGSLVVHKVATDPCDLLEFETGMASWTRSQTDIFVPKTRARSHVSLGQLSRYLHPGTDATPRLSLSKYSFALELSPAQLCDGSF
jgi:hypothetical protein